MHGSSHNPLTQMLKKPPKQTNNKRCSFWLLIQGIGIIVPLQTERLSCYWCAFIDSRNNLCVHLQAGKLGFNFNLPGLKGLLCFQLIIHRQIFILTFQHSRLHPDCIDFSWGGSFGDHSSGQDCELSRVLSHSSLLSSDTIQDAII